MSTIKDANKIKSKTKCMLSFSRTRIIITNLEKTSAVNEENVKTAAADFYKTS